MKMRLGMIVGVVLGVVILLAGGALLINYAVNQITNQTSQPSSSLKLPSVPPQQPTVTSPTVTAPTPSVIFTPVAPAASVSNQVNFNVQITNMTGTGLTRSVTAKIANTGSLDAHNVTGKVEVFSSGKLVTIAGNGQTSITQTLGTIKAGQTIDTQLNLAFALGDALTLTQNGVTVSLIITSDEKTQTIKYDFKP